MGFGVRFWCLVCVMCDLRLMWGVLVEKPTVLALLSHPSHHNTSFKGSKHSKSTGSGDIPQMSPDLEDHGT